MLRTLRALLIFIRLPEYIPPPDWTDGDAQNLRSFLTSETGQKLNQAFLNQVVRQNDSAVSSGNPEKACPFANGFRYCVAFVESLAAPQKISKESGNGIPDDLDHLIP